MNFAYRYVPLDAYLACIESEAPSGPLAFFSEDEATIEELCHNYPGRVVDARSILEPLHLSEPQRALVEFMLISRSRIVIGGGSQFCQLPSKLEEKNVSTRSGTRPPRQLLLMSPDLSHQVTIVMKGWRWCWTSVRVVPTNWHERDCRCASSTPHPSSGPGSPTSLDLISMSLKRVSSRYPAQDREAPGRMRALCGCPKTGRSYDTIWRAKSDPKSGLGNRCNRTRRGVSVRVCSKGYLVHGMKRRSSSFNTGRIEHLYQDHIEKNPQLVLHYGDMTDSTNLIRIVRETAPDEIYNLAAQSHVQVSFEIQSTRRTPTRLGHCASWKRYACSD